MTPQEACADLANAIGTHAPIDDTGKTSLLAWCEARRDTLTTPLGEALARKLSDRLSGCHWISDMAKHRPGGMIDAHGIASIEAAMQSDTPLCT